MKNLKSLKVMEKVITLQNHFTSMTITNKDVEECEEIVLSKMEELNYNTATCYSVAAISLFLDTLKKEEKKEILSILHLQEKQYDKY